MEHCSLFHDQHELASLHAGNDHELSDADGRFGVPQFRVGCSGHCAGHRRDPRSFAERIENHRQLLGGFDALLSLGVAASLSCRFSGPDFTGRCAKPEALCDGSAYVEPQTVQTPGSDGKTISKTLTQQVIALGPTASQEAIKMFGTNGGGFFYAQQRASFRKSNTILQFFPDAFDFRDSLWLDLHARPHDELSGAWMGRVGRDDGALSRWGDCGVLGRSEGESASFTEWIRRASALHSGGNMEGKEVRFGIANSALFATITTDASCGAVNSMHDSYTPLGGMVPLVNIMLGEVIFGGVGSGLYGILVFVILAVFIAGLNGWDEHRNIWARRSSRST